MSDVAPVYRDVYLTMDPNDIKVHEEVRIRQTTPFLEQQIEAMMHSFKISGQLNRIIIDENDYLIAGYIRLIAARKLSMKINVVKKYGLSDYQKYFIEIQENATRTNFTSYEFTIGLAQLKQKYEKKHPETKWGRNQYISGTVRRTNPQYELPLGFVKEHAKIFLLSERTIRDKIMVGEAILAGKFDKKTITQFKEDKITYTDLRERMRNREHLKKEKEHLLSKKRKKNQESDKQKTPKSEEQENREVEKIPDKSKEEKGSKTKGKRMEETLPVPPTPPLPQNDANTITPPGLPGGPTIKKFNDKTKTFVEVPATCKDCPSGRAFVCIDCGAMMIRCHHDEKEGKFGIYMGTHFACHRFPQEKETSPF